MRQKDFRGIGRDTQEALRARAVFLVHTVGKSQAEAAEAVGVSRQTVYQWMKRHAKGGEAGLLDGRRVSARKGKGKLTAAEAVRVQRWIRDKCPDQLKMPYVLWTAPVVRDLIRLRLGKNLGLSTVQLYLKRWRFTPQRPLKRATQRSPEAIRRWLEEEYPKIARRAKREKAPLYWGDETGISNQDQVGRGYAPRGKTPVVRLTAKKITTSMISAVTNQGLMRFMCYKGALNAGLFIVFLRRLIKSAGRKVFLIVDNLRVHHAVKVSEWVAAHGDEQVRHLAGAVHVIENIRFGHVVESAQIGSRAEIAARARQEDQAVRTQHRFLQFCDQLRIQSVTLFGPIQSDSGNALLNLVKNQRRSPSAAAQRCRFFPEHRLSETVCRRHPDFRAAGS